MDLIDELSDIGGRFLIENGFTQNEGLYSKLEAHVEVIPSFLRHSRSLCIVIRNITESTPRNYRSILTEGLGLIRDVHLQVPMELPIDCDQLVAELGCHVKKTYFALEQALIRNSGELQHRVFDKLYDCIEYHLKVASKEYLMGRFWLFISDSETGYYFLDENVLRKVIDFYKSHQDDVRSPFELTIWFMTSPLPFQKSLAIQAWKQNLTIKSQPWLQAGYIDDAPKIYMSEKTLFDLDSYSRMTLFEKRGFFLVVALPTDIKEDLKPRVLEAKNDLEFEFERALKMWSPHVRVVRKIATEIEQSSAATFLATFLAEFTATTMKSWSRT